MSDTQWSRADRAGAALQEWCNEAGIDGYGDEGSHEFDEAVLGLLTDLKFLLWRAGGSLYELAELSDEAVKRWSDLCDNLPEGGPDGENPWDLTREHPDEYNAWTDEVRNGDTLLGFVEWFDTLDVDNAGDDSGE